MIIVNGWICDCGVLGFILEGVIVGLCLRVELVCCDVVGLIL